ncbi:GntR family transcriptional regulator [Novosphingobium album (ex Liu et al. 2023)]|uniref:GntR family transcriptional regulator n=1 Tax=Novosphingobium album (ex Liu et al. 2023) TaxID=3031130 RepID=A0ABT5WXK5_9SPHN|nr:GntR family transcriptional regulator [Novosphingobium album (ex Liu et al. 2023)]MDE8654622.1 GntR family transcriptional regulator [Novosphingobium album (ex Liu et al. 2023)]
MRTPRKIRLPSEGSERLSPTIYHELQSRILSGIHRPGEWLSVEEIAKAFEVSRQPVMEAMRRLSGDWLVEIVPQVGCRVASYEVQSMFDFIEAFGGIQSRLAELATARRTDEQLIQLQILMDEINLQTELDQENLRLGHEFHRIIQEMAHSEVLSRLCEQMWAFGTFAFNNLVTQGAQSEHVELRRSNLARLVKAIEDRDGASARTLTEIWLTGRGGWFAFDPESGAEKA